MSPEVIRPIRGPLMVTLPYRVGNRRFLELLGGPRTTVEWEKPYWRVSRAHMWTVVTGIADEYGMVTVRQRGAAQTKCVERCWAASPDTVLDCVCSCAGANHGSGHPIGKLVKADLSVHTDYTEYVYEVHR